MNRTLNLVDVEVTDIYRVDILKAMRTLKRLWVAMKSSVINDCWRRTGMPSELPADGIEFGRLSAANGQTLTELLQQLFSAVSRIPVPVFLRIPYKEEYIE